MESKREGKKYFLTFWPIFYRSLFTLKKNRNVTNNDYDSEEEFLPTNLL